jgi:hypothetical protein
MPCVTLLHHSRTFQQLSNSFHGSRVFAAQTVRISCRAADIALITGEKPSKSLLGEIEECTHDQKSEKF